MSQAAHRVARARGRAVVQHLHNYRWWCANGLMTVAGRPSEGCLAGDYRCAWRDRCHRGSAAQGLARAAVLVLQRRLGLAGAVDRFVAVSEHVRARHVAHGLPAERIAVVPHFVDPERLPAPPAAPGRELVYAGRLVPEKGVSTLLRAVARASRRLPLAVLGDGPERGRLEAEARALGLERVEFAGSLPRDRALERIAAARALVLPSECPETFGLVLIEAMACGVPVVASRTGGIPEVVAEGTGALVPPGDAAALAERLDWIAALPDGERDALGRTARAHARARFSPGAFHDRLVAVYREAVAAAAAR